MTYLDWLKNQIEYFDGPSHNILLEHLYTLSFTPRINRDINRESDGIRLRDEYFVDGVDEESIIDTPCSFLEFLIGLARRMNYIYSRIDEDRTRDCFWMMIDNLELTCFDDRYLSRAPGRIRAITEAVNIVVDRTYEEDGSGGLFPLKHPRENQRNVEIWYQMQQYLNELMREEGRM